VFVNAGPPETLVPGEMMSKPGAASQIQCDCPIKNQIIKTETIMKIRSATVGLMMGLAACAAASHAQIQSNVTMYGVIDTGVEYVNNVGAGRDGLARMPTLTGTLPNWLGFRGAEDLGDGLKALFTLENGFAPDTGAANQGGRLFGRQAFVGLSNSWGTLTLGRQYTQYFWSILDSYLMGPNVYSMIALDSYLPNARADNSIAYRGTFNGFTVGLGYSLGRDAVNAGPSPAGTNCAGENPANKRQCREWSAMVKYNAETWGAAMGTDRLYGGPGAFGGLTSSSLSDTRTTLNGFVKFGSLKLGGGLIRRNNQGSVTPRSDLYFLDAAYLLTPALLLDGELSRLIVRDASSNATLLALRATYNFSKLTAAYVTAGHIANGGASAVSVSAGGGGTNPGPGVSQMGLMVGVRKFF
jgi:predicted porin